MPTKKTFEKEAKKFKDCTRHIQFFSVFHFFENFFPSNTLCLLTSTFPVKHQEIMLYEY